MTSMFAGRHAVTAAEQAGAAEVYQLLPKWTVRSAS
jgi:hypothetical protein